MKLRLDLTLQNLLHLQADGFYKCTVTTTTDSSADTVNSINCGSLSVLKTNLVRDSKDTKASQRKIISHEASLH